MGWNLANKYYIQAGTEGNYILWINTKGDNTVNINKAKIYTQYAAHMKVKLNPELIMWEKRYIDKICVTRVEKDKCLKASEIEIGLN